MISDPPTPDELRKADKFQRTFQNRDLIPCKKCSEKTNKEVFHAAPACGPEYRIEVSTVESRYYMRCVTVSKNGANIAYLPLHENTTWLEDGAREVANKFIEVLKQMDAERSSNH